MIIGLLGVVNVLLRARPRLQREPGSRGNPHSTYVFLVVSSTGVCLISSLGHVFGTRNSSSSANGRSAAILICSWFRHHAMELNHPAHGAPPSSALFTSAIWWMGTLYGLYLVLLCGSSAS
jgi:molybdopterin-containing oxidoreductase family membrane subunit